MAYLKATDKTITAIRKAYRLPTVIRKGGKHKSISSPGKGGGAAPIAPYNSWFKVIDISTYDGETGVFTGEVIICYGDSYISPQPDADPPIEEDYLDTAGNFKVNAFSQVMAAKKFTITESKILVCYSELSSSTPFISVPTFKLVSDIELELPAKRSFEIIAVLTFTETVGVFGGEDFVPASIYISQSWEDGNISLREFMDTNIV